MKYKDAKLKIYALGLEFRRSHLNRVVPHNKNETHKHFLIKCLLVRYFLLKAETVFTEYKIGRGIFDVFNLDRMICYEVETTPSSTIYEEKVKLLQGYNYQIEIIIIDSNKYHYNFKEALKQLSGRVG